MDGDEFTEDPVSVLNQVENFINVQKFFTEKHFDFTGKIFLFLYILYFFPIF